jgi:pilus assembly protein CpaF
MDAASVVETEVRNRVKVRGIDPLTDPASVRRVVDEVLADYAQSSLSSAAEPIANGREVARDVVDAVAGLGPLQQYLDDPEIEEIWINEPGRVFVARRGQSELTPTLLADDQVRDLVERMLKPSNRRVDLSSPFVDATLPDGSRIHVVIPDITREHWAVNIRKFVVRAERLDHLVELGTLSAGAARFLDAAVAAGLNIIVSGGTQAGKTTLLNCLAAAIPASERVITVEEVFELT